ncbi:MAG: tetratricopeptide repeat protein [Hyphomonadaceae bacterium]|nr:tetratricopeptide repeat protein [Hyphomonadaceae bacterium]
MTSASPPNAVLAAAVQKLRSGQAREADAILQAALKTSPKDVDLLAVAGGVARQLGRPGEAVALLQRAVALQPRSAPLHNSLGAARKANGDLAGAQDAFAQAVALQPDLFDAHFNLGLSLDAAGAYAQALTPLRRAAELAPNRSEAHEALGNVLVRAGEPAEGLEALKRAAALKPGSASIAHNMGIAHEALKDDAAALAAFKEAVQRAPQQAVSWFGIGNVERRAGAHAAAINAYRQAIEIKPNYLEAHEALNDTTWEAAEQGLLASYPYAIQRMPQDAGLHRAYANQLIRVRQLGEAETYARQALSLEPDNPASHDALGKTLFGAQRFAEAAESFKRAADLAPKDQRAWASYADALVRDAKLGDAHDALTRALTLAPYDQENLARMSVLLRLLGEAQAYGKLVDYDALTSVISVRAPEGFKDIQAFHRELAPYLQSKHLTKQAPSGQTLTGGTQTLGALFADPHPLIQGLRQSLHDAVMSFVAALPDDPSHPFYGRRQKAIAFAGSWSVRLACGGYHVNHTHSAGWISSAYYIELPEAVGGDSRQGWFKMGETNPDLSPDLPAERWVQPEEGKLVLFPSYVWHGTQSFDQGDQRLTVAFDVIPASD